MCFRARGGVTASTVSSQSLGHSVDRRGHVGVVTSRQRYVNPLMDRDEVRLPNPRKTKVLSVRLDKSSTIAAPVAWEIFQQAGPSAHMQRPTYGILMMERRPAFTRLLLMVSKCSPVKMYFLFG